MTHQAQIEADLYETMLYLGQNARKASSELAKAGPDKRSAALLAMAQCIRDSCDDILAANAKDMKAGREKELTAALLDRLELSPERVESMASGIEAISTLQDPVGDVIAEWERPNGLKISRIRGPIGVIGIIYESRPNVTADAGALCVRAANAAILRGGSESVHSSKAIGKALASGLVKVGLPAAAIQLVPTTDRTAVGHMLAGLNGQLDVVVPRGGKSLVARVQEEARIPVIGHLEGLCHTYVDGAADLDKALDIVENAKMRRPGICGATETVLIDKDIADHVAPALAQRLQARKCNIWGCAQTLKLVQGAHLALEENWSTEYLDAVINMKIVDGVKGAIEHIENYGSGHTEAIITENEDTADTFLREVDASIVMHNTSTQFADGGEFGMGAEIGIATGRLHARGPVGAEQLTIFKYVVRGTGQTRP